MNKRVLLIEDSIEINTLIELHLENLNFDVDKAFDGDIGLDKAINNKYNLIILDLFLPKVGGLEICQSLRNAGDKTPILLVSAMSENPDKNKCFEVGANAYLTKPFSIQTLTENVQKLTEANNVDTLIKNVTSLDCKTHAFKDFIIDTEKHVLIVNSETLFLKEKEYQLLNLFVCNPGKIFSRSEILKLIWGFDLKEYRYKVNSCVSRIRQKVEPDFSNPIYILPSNEGGYKFNEQMLSSEN